MVGDSTISSDCACTPDMDPEDVEYAFRAVNTGGGWALTGLSPSADAMGWARDVNTAQGSDPLRIAGWTDCGDGPLTGAPGCKTVDLCRPPRDAVLWQPSTLSSLTDLGTKGAQAHGVNNAGRIAGWGFTDQTECMRRALYWSGVGASPVNLGNTMPSGMSGNASRAEALNDATLQQVLGWNSQVGGALLWERDSGGTWSVVDLNASSAIGGCNSRWGLFEGHDLNDADWIVVLGVDLAGSTGTHAVLLTPFPTGCIADIVADDCININDLLAVISAAGACPIGAFCNADITGDCVVDINDILAVNAVYCADPCPTPVPSCCDGCQQCGGSSFGGGSGQDGPLSVEELITLILEADIPEDTQAALIEPLLSL